VKHAGDATLNELEGLLKQIRGCSGLTERKRGIFYRAARAVLHFHEDAAGIFAHLKVGSEYLRFRVSTRAEQRELMRAIQAQLKPS
jgi:hypothetical protein